MFTQDKDGKLSMSEHTALYHLMYSLTSANPPPEAPCAMPCPRILILTPETGRCQKAIDTGGVCCARYGDVPDQRCLGKTLMLCRQDKDGQLTLEEFSRGTWTNAYLWECFNGLAQASHHEPGLSVLSEGGRQARTVEFFPEVASAQVPLTPCQP